MPHPSLDPTRPLVRFACGDFDAVYNIDPDTHAVSFRLLPHACTVLEVAPRTHILDTPEVVHRPAAWGPMAARCGDASLIQLKLREDPIGNMWANGRTLRHNATLDGLRFAAQTADALIGGGWHIVTTLNGARAFHCRHVLHYQASDEAVTVHTEFANTGDVPLMLELLASFCLSHLTPYASDDAPERLRLHRFRSVWAGEGRHESPLLEDIHLERAWGTTANNVERFGQVGSLPVRGWFPWAAIEDTTTGVFWGAQLHAPASWQIEVLRRDDKISLSGGLADREFGQWAKTVGPGETFVAPIAWLSTARAGLDEFAQRLTRMQTAALADQPASEQSLPIIFNEWCSTWGHPTPAFIERTAARLQTTPTRIFVIDAGWFEDPNKVGQFNGDWTVDRAAFPNGLKPVCDDLRARGFVPGIWFEFENATEGTTAYTLSDHHLQREGRPLQVGNRRFWNFQDPRTVEWLSQRVIARLREDGFGYMKVDYNDSIGLGADHPDGLGEGLRLNQIAAQNFFRKIRAEIPGILIESCSSGGHRLEPSFLGLTAMSSFSDAHETWDVPIIGANLHWLMLPRQSQMWAVLHPSDTAQRLHWSLASCFLGRLCLSGQVAELDVDQMKLLNDDLALYQQVAHLIHDGESRLTRSLSKSWRHPRGWQAVVRASRSGPREALVVVHAFGATAGTTSKAKLPAAGRWEIVAERGIGLARASLIREELRFTATSDFSAYLAHVRLQ